MVYLKMHQRTAAAQQHAASANGVDGTLHINGMQIPGLNGTTANAAVKGHISPARPPTQSPSNQMVVTAICIIIGTASDHMTLATRCRKHNKSTEYRLNTLFQTLFKLM